MLLFILCGVYIWKWVERVREIRVETRRGFRRFVKWNDGRTRYCLYIAGIPISFFFFCCRCDALFIVAMYFFFLVPLSFAFFLNRNLIFGTCTLFVLFIIGILSSASSCYFRVNIFKSFFTVETSPTCSRIVSLSLKSILLVYVFPSCIFATAVHRFESCIPPLLHPRVWKTFQSFNFIMLEYRTKVLLKEKSLRDWWIIFHTALDWTLSAQVVGIGTGQEWFHRKCSYISDHVTIDRSQSKR